MWKNPNAETKTEMNFNFIDQLSVIKNIIILNNLKCCDLRMVRHKVKIDLNRQKEMLQQSIKPNIVTLKAMWKKSRLD